MLIQLLSLLLCFSIFHSPLAVAAEREQQKSIQLFFADLVQAFNDRDYEAIGSSWTEEGQIFTLAGGIVSGTESIKQFYRNIFLQKEYEDSKLELTLQYVRALGPDVTVVDGVWKITDHSAPDYPSCGIFIANLSRHDPAWKLDTFYSSVPRHGHTREMGRKISWTKICENE